MIRAALASEERGARAPDVRLPAINRGGSRTDVPRTTDAEGPHSRPFHEQSPFPRKPYCLCPQKPCGLLAGLRTHGHFRAASAFLLTIASHPLGAVLHDGVRSQIPLRGSSGVSPDSLLSVLRLVEHTNNVTDCRYLGRASQPQNFQKSSRGEKTACLAPRNVRVVREVALTEKRLRRKCQPALARQSHQRFRTDGGA